MNSSGASLSTANQESTSVSSGPTGCHSRSEMNGRTSSDSPTFGQLCTKLRFGNTDAAEIMNPSSPMTARWSGDHSRTILSIMTSG